MNGLTTPQRTTPKYHPRFRPLKSLPSMPLVGKLLSLGPQVMQVWFVATASQERLHLHVEVHLMPN